MAVVAPEVRHPVGSVPWARTGAAESRHGPGSPRRLRVRLMPPVGWRARGRCLTPSVVRWLTRIERRQPSAGGAPGATVDHRRQVTGGGPGRGRAAEDGGILARTLMPSHRHRFRARRARHLILRGGCRRRRSCGAHLRNMLCSLAKAFLRPVLRRTQRILSFVFFLRSPRTSMVPCGEACSESARVREVSRL